jgi:integrase
MPRPRSLKPKYCQDRSTNRAFVIIDGRKHYLGGYGSQESKDRYDQLIGEWIANGRRAAPSTVVGASDAAPTSRTTVSEVVLRYWTHAQTYYRKPDGTPTSEVNTLKQALKPLRRLYGLTPVADFGPLALKAVREAMIEQSWCRRYVNQQIARLKQMFKWVVENELAPPSVFHAVVAVGGLRKGRSEVRESEPVRPVADILVEQVLPHLPPQVRAMVELQRLTGMRPTEVCTIRGCDLDRSRAVWFYRPADHKTAHHGHERRVPIGPRAQEILRPFIRFEGSAYLFSPVEAEARRHEQQRESRRSPMTPSQAGRRPKTDPKRTPGKRYTRTSYGRAIRRACDRAFSAPDGATGEGLRKWRKEHRWHPHQLRHTAATQIRREFGLEAAQVVLGHKTAAITQIYAERDEQVAAEVMSRIG